MKIYCFSRYIKTEADFCLFSTFFIESYKPVFDRYLIAIDFKKTVYFRKGIFRKNKFLEIYL